MIELRVPSREWIRVIQYAVQTPEGAWRVEVVKRGRSRWYRLVNGDNDLDWLSIAAAQRLLGEAGIAVSDLDEVTDRPHMASASIHRPG
jgi:hypothetical protein